MPSIVDLTRLAAWMDGEGLEGGPIEGARLLAGGTQNILIRFARGGREFVFRRPPAVPRSGSNGIMTRETRLLRALAGTAVPHPDLIAACIDETVLGTVFYLMEPVDGFNPTIALPEHVGAEPAIRHHMGEELADGLAALAMLDYKAAGLADFGRLEAFLERQSARWAAELAGYTQFEGWSGPGALGDVGAVARWLDANRPADFHPGIIHGDYHVGNVIYGDDGALLAIVDWEMATLGDPLVDLGRLLVSWPEDGNHQPYTMRVDVLDGWPSRGEMIARYKLRTGRDLAALPWFEALACYKLGILLEGTHARAQAGLADRETGLRLHESAVALFDRARSITGLEHVRRW